MLEMYKGMINSPETTITNDISNSDTLIYVFDENSIPESLPNLMVLGTGRNSETIKVLSRVDQLLTVVRGFQGVARSWNSGSVISRNFTEYDYNALVENINELESGKVNNDRVKTDVPEDANFNDTITEVLDTLTSTETNKALSANQGKKLKDDLDTHKAEKATQNEYGHITLQDIPTPTKASIGLGNGDNVKQMTISGRVLENYREKLVTTTGAINLNLGNVFYRNATANTTFSITNAVNNQAHSFTLIIDMGATVRTLSFPSSIKWQGGDIPDLTTVNKTYVLTFLSTNGGTTWLGMFGGEF